MIGQLLAGHYRVIEKLGAGGFGQTYIAEDIHRPGNPRCVVKHLKPASTDPQVLEIARKLFNKEAETLEKLGVHSQIPRLLAYFEEQEQFFLVQELIPGHPLSNELPPGKTLSPEKVTALLQEVLNVLKFVHGQRVIHRDIKPDNLIRDNTNNKLVLIDFGAIKQVRNQPLTQEGLISATVAVGTPGYMPTEQARGTPRPNSDIYALGMVGIQALTGIMPYQLAEDNDTGEILWQQHLVTASPGLVAILERMTRYHFRDRYSNVNQVIEALSQLGNNTMPASVKPTQLATALGQQTVQEIALEWREAGEIRRQVVREGQPSKNPGTVRLGRDRSRCDVVFSDPGVSGLQGEIFFHPQQGGIYLRALRATNPVQVDGQSFATGEAPLYQGSQIQLGQTQVRVISITSTASQGSSSPPQPIDPTQFNNHTRVPPTAPVPEPAIPNPTTEQTVAVSPGSYSASTATPTSSPPGKSRLPLLIGSLVTASMLGIAGGFGMIQFLGNPNPNPDPNPTPTVTPDPPQAKACLAQIVNGNIRKEPASFFDNVITTFAKRSLPVTGKQTQGGWIEVEVNNTSGWVHRSVIRNEGEIDSCLQDKGQKIEYIADIPRPPAKGEKFLQQARELAAQGEWQGAINLAEKVPADSELFDEAQNLVEEWKGNIPTQPVNPTPPTESPDPVEPPPGETLNQILPEYVANALDMSEVFAKCPGKTELYLFGETKKYNFAVCGNNNKPRYYIGQRKDSQDTITVPWLGGFYNGGYLYEPPIYGQINSTDNQLQVYLKGDLIVKDGIVRLYEGSGN